MAAQGLEARVRIQLLIALAGEQDGDGAGALEAAARDLGLTGAEIDAARACRCFDVRAAAVVNLALALRAGDPARIEAARAGAGRAGFGADDLEAIERLAGENDHGLTDGSRGHA